VQAIAAAVTDRRIKPEYFSGANARVLSKVLARLPRPMRESAVASALGVKGVQAPRDRPHGLSRVGGTGRRPDAVPRAADVEGLGVRIPDVRMGVGGP
jgi:hypothetical protein